MKLDDRDPRVEALGPEPGIADGTHVLYWMVSARRTRDNHALDRALAWARELAQPLVVLEALRCDYPWASDRFHRFVMDGMQENAERFAAAGIHHHAYVEPQPGAGKGLLEAYAASASLVVTDLFPCFFIPRMQEAVAPRLGRRFERVDSNGLMPLAVVDRTYQRAYDFRRFLQRNLEPHLQYAPEPDPLAGLELPGVPDDVRAVTSRWRGVDPADENGLRDIPIDHSVATVALRGGEKTAMRLLDGLVGDKLGVYHERRNDVSEDSASGLSAHLHFGHVGSWTIFRAIAESEGWRPESLGDQRSGARAGYWGMSEGAEAFLDQLVTWRELGYSYCARVANHDAWESLPAWARATLDEHAADVREHPYTRAELDAAQTHDPLWNATQNQLRSEGRIHNYLRMLWGKKILEWSPGPREALETLIELNNRYAVDGRNPNSYTGICWTLGRFDRAWGPERPVFGKIRYMSSDSTRRKFRVGPYVERYSQPNLF